MGYVRSPTLINHGSDDIAHVTFSLCGNKDSETFLHRPAQIISLDKQGGGSARFKWDLAKVIRALTQQWWGVGNAPGDHQAVQNQGSAGLADQ